MSTDPAVVRDLEARSGLEVFGAFAFGDTPQLQDRLLAFVAGGTKRATAGSLAELEEEDDPFPAPGQLWGLLDGSGRARYVAETVAVTTGRLDSVDPAFAWDEGEDDRTRESWLESHRRFFQRMGVEEPDAMPTVFERFRIVWPEPDRTVWLADDVRELRHDERDWAMTQLPAVDGLPTLVRERDGERLGLLGFRPRPGVETDIVAVAALDGTSATADALHRAIRELGRRSGWRRVAQTDLRDPEER